MNRSIQYHLSKTDVVSTLSYRLSRLYACMLSCFSHVQFCETLWTVACQAPLSMGFSRQEHWSGFLWPPPGDLPDPGIKLASLMSPELAGGFFTASTTWEALHMHMFFKKTFWCAKIVENTHTHEYNKTGEIWMRSVDYITVNIPILQNVTIGGDCKSGSSLYYFLQRHVNL